MKQFFGVVLVQFLIFLFFGIKLYGGTISSFLDVDNTLSDTGQVLKKVEDTANIIKRSATGKSVYSVLEKYPKKDEAKVASSWFRMATQLTSNRKMAFFITNSSYKVKALLSKLSLLKKNPLDKANREFLFKKIDYLINRTAIDRPTKLDEIHKSKMDLFIRSMPIVNPLTKKRSLKKFKVLKKGQKFKLLYKLQYKHKEGYILRWGFIENLKNHQQGWVNLNKINIK
jgi:hypothetical protein